MLTAEENERLTRVGPGTPMGDLLRRYWHPIAATSQLDENPVKPIKILGESLVLYRDRSGRLGLVQAACAHRRVNLVFGIPEDEGIRCPYHGWRYDNTGQCVEMPAEPEDTTFPQRVKLTAYPVQELSGLIFAYMGPQPAPLLPRWDLFVVDNVRRDIGFQVVECNWLQMQENNFDPTHLQWLHGYYSNYVLERLGRPDLRRLRGAPQRDLREWEPFEYGIVKRRRPVGASEDEPQWSVGDGSLFPNIETVNLHFQYRVPIDDTHTMHIYYCVYPMPPGEAVDETTIPYWNIPSPIDPDGNPIWAELDGNGAQDTMAWVAQGPIMDRTQEKLGDTDRGVIIWRELLQRQLKIVEDGGEPMNIIRNPAQNVRIDVPRYGEKIEWHGPNAGYMTRVNGGLKYSPTVQEMVERFHGKEALLEPVHSLGRPGPAPASV